MDDFARREARPHGVDLLVGDHAVAGASLTREEEQAGDDLELVRHQLGQVDERILSRVELVGGDGAGLHLRVLCRTLHDLVLALDGAVVGRQLALLEEQAQHEPEKGQRREGAVEKVAHVAELLAEEVRPAEARRDVVDAASEPERRERETELYAPVAPRGAFVVRDCLCRHRDPPIRPARRQHATLPGAPRPAPSRARAVCRGSVRAREG